MTLHHFNPLLLFYGCFLICCGLASVIFIGSKAKTALISGGTMGMIALLLAYVAPQQNMSTKLGGIFLSTFLFCIFSWRANKTLNAIFALIATQDDTLKSKGTAFMIISLMAVVSLLVTLLQYLQM